MKTIWTIATMELRMQARRPIFWLALAGLVALAQLETFPSAANLRRLTHLDMSAYAAGRTFLMAMPLAAIVAAILTTGRVRIDRQLEMDSLLWTSPQMTALRYGFGKWLGAFATFALFPLALGLVSLSIRAMFFPDGFAAIDFIKATMLAGLLPLMYAVTLGFCLGTLLGSRLAGLLLTLYFLMSSIATSAHPVTGAIPVYRFMGDLYSLIFAYPGWQYQAERIAAGWQTVGFETLSTLAALGLALGVISWRSKEVLR